MVFDCGWLWLCREVQMASIWKKCRRESRSIYLIKDDSWYWGLALSFEIRSKALTVEEVWLLKFFKRKSIWKLSDNCIWPNWWPGVTRIKVLSSYNPVQRFKRGTVRHTAVTKKKKIWHGFGHYSSTHVIPYLVLRIHRRFFFKTCSSARKRHNFPTSVTFSA